MKLAFFAIGMLLSWLFLRIRLGSAKQIAAKIIEQADREVQESFRKADLAIEQKQIEQRDRLQRLSEQNRDRERREAERLAQYQQRVERSAKDLERREQSIDRQQQAVEKLSKKLAEAEQRVAEELQNISGITSGEAKEILLERLRSEVNQESAQLIQRARKEAEEQAEQRAKQIIITSIHRLALPCVSDTAATTVSLPSEDMKGRIIGREGRNIRLLERELGVNILIDDLPGAIVLSGFDPLRKQVAKMVLSELLQDGRIHPTRIQEVVEQKRRELDTLIYSYGEDAALRAGALNLCSELIQLLGSLKLRSSYGQNVLDHSLEVSYLMGLMATELGLNSPLAKRIGLLHDIGKAISHKQSGSHAKIGMDIALRYGESSSVANGIGCHHQEIDPSTLEGSLCRAADSLSASRPGARSGALEEYLQRVKRLEEITYEFPGIERAYAMQAGREIHISVLPDIIDDIGAAHLAKDIRKKIEERINMPGQIRVTVIREKRIVEYAG